MWHILSAEPLGIRVWAWIVGFWISGIASSIVVLIQTMPCDCVTCVRYHGKYDIFGLKRTEHAAK